MEVLRQGWSIREVFHPQFLVRRDLEGKLLGIVSTSDADHDPSVVPESWMHLEILPPSRTESRETLIPELEQGLLEVLRLVEEAVQDWQKMITRSEETIEMLKDPQFINGHADQAALACELLSWLNTNHFTFLGYREYDVITEESGIAVQGSSWDGPRHLAGGPGSTRHLPRDPATQRHSRVDDHHQGQPEIPGTPAGLPRLHRLPHLRRRTSR